LGADLRRFQRMVGDLLEISRSDTGSADVSLEEVEAGELVRQSVAAAHGRYQRRGRPAVLVDQAVAGTWLTVDKRRFERIMANLLENAASTAAGTEVRPRSATPARWVDLAAGSVEDHGPGLAPAERDKVFERFYRGDAAGRRERDRHRTRTSLVAEHVRLNAARLGRRDRRGGAAS